MKDSLHLLNHFEDFIFEKKLQLFIERKSSHSLQILEDKFGSFLRNISLLEVAKGKQTHFL
jgi:hypothetical protein